MIRLTRLRNDHALFLNPDIQAGPQVKEPLASFGVPVGNVTPRDAPQLDGHRTPKWQGGQNGPQPAQPGQSVVREHHHVGLGSRIEQCERAAPTGRHRVTKRSRTVHQFGVMLPKTFHGSGPRLRKVVAGWKVPAPTRMS